MAGKILTAEHLREVLHYDPETGIFTRRVAMGGRPVGEVAGYRHSRGYVHISVYDKRYKAHRLAWLYMTGEWPPNQIDHENTVRHNNWWTNLRLATNAQNQQNLRKARADNKSGLLGVHRNGGRWRAMIYVNGKKIHVGCFPTAEAAHAAYLSAKAIHHPFQTIVEVNP